VSVTWSGAGKKKVTRRLPTDSCIEKCYCDWCSVGAPTAINFRLKLPAAAHWRLRLPTAIY